MILLFSHQTHTWIIHIASNIDRLSSICDSSSLRPTYLAYQYIKTINNLDRKKVSSVFFYILLRAVHEIR